MKSVLLDAGKQKIHFFFIYSPAKDEKVRSILREVERLSEDAATLSHISELSGTLHCSHSSLDETVREMLTTVNRQLQERQSGDAQLACLEVNLSTQ